MAMYLEVSEPPDGGHSTYTIIQSDFAAICFIVRRSEHVEGYDARKAWFGRVYSTRKNIDNFNLLQITVSAKDFAYYCRLCEQYEEILDQLPSDDEIRERLLATQEQSAIKFSRIRNLAYDRAFRYIEM